MPELKKIKDWENLKLLLKLYAFETKVEELKSLPTGQETVTFEKTTSWSRTTLTLTKILKTEVNERNTLKLVLFDNGVLGFIQPQLIGRSEEILNIPWNSNPEPLWERIKEGVYALIDESYWGSWRLVAVTDITTKEEAKEFFRVYKRILQIQEENDFRELERVKRLDYDGYLTMEEWRKHLKLQEETLKKCLELERLEEIKRKKALKNISIVEEFHEDTRKVVKVKIKGLDEHIYRLEIINPNIKIPREAFESLVYRHRYSLEAYSLENIKQNTLFHDFFEKVDALLDHTNDPMVIQVDRRKAVTLMRKKVKTRTTSYHLYYVNGVKISQDTLPKTLYQYFIEKKELNLPKPRRGGGRSKSKEELLTARERELIENGISGKLSDLEGEIPINFGIEKEGTKWYLTIGEKKIHIKGGLATIESIKNVIEGKANRYSARYSPEELYYRLSKIVDEETALEIITTAKELGIMLRAITK